jgi:hypothetical protein
MTRTVWAERCNRWDAGYVPYINHSYGTSGTLWEGRYKASLLDDEPYLLTCMRYIELNPVHANRVKSPGAYRLVELSRQCLGKTRYPRHAASVIPSLGPNKETAPRALPGLIPCPYRCGCAERYSSGVPDGHAFGRRCLQGDN